MYVFVKIKSVERPFWIVGIVIVPTSGTGAKEVYAVVNVQTVFKPSIVVVYVIITVTVAIIDGVLDGADDVNGPGIDVMLA